MRSARSCVACVHSKRVYCTGCNSWRVLSGYSSSVVLCRGTRWCCGRTFVRGKAPLVQCLSILSRLVFSRKMPRVRKEHPVRRQKSGDMSQMDFVNSRFLVTRKTEEVNSTEVIPSCATSQQTSQRACVGFGTARGPCVGGDKGVHFPCRGYRNLSLSSVACVQ